MIHQISTNQIKSLLKESISKLGSSIQLLSKKDFYKINFFQVSPHNFSQFSYHLNNFLNTFPKFSPDGHRAMTNDHASYNFLRKNLSLTKTGAKDFKKTHSELLKIQNIIHKLNLNYDTFAFYQIISQNTYNHHLAIELHLNNNELYLDLQAMAYAIQLFQFPTKNSHIEFFKDTPLYIQSTYNLESFFTNTNKPNFEITKNIVLGTPINLYSLLQKHSVLGESNFEIPLYQILQKITHTNVSPETQKSIYSLYLADSVQFSVDLLYILDKHPELLENHKFFFQSKNLSLETCDNDEFYILPIDSSFKIFTLFTNKQNEKVFLKVIDKIITDEPNLNNLILEVYLDNIFQNQSFDSNLSYQDILSSLIIKNSLETKDLPRFVANSLFLFNFLDEYRSSIREQLSLSTKNMNYIIALHDSKNYDNQSFENLESNTFNYVLFFLTHYNNQFLDNHTDIKTWILNNGGDYSEKLMEVFYKTEDSLYCELIKENFTEFFSIFFNKNIEQEDFNLKNYPKLTGILFKETIDEQNILLSLKSEYMGLGIFLIMKSPNKLINFNDDFINDTIKLLLTINDENVRVSIIYYMYFHIENLLERLSEDLRHEVFKNIIVTSNYMYNNSIKNNLVIGNNIPFNWISELDNYNVHPENVKEFSELHLLNLINNVSETNDNIIKKYNVIFTNYTSSAFDSLDDKQLTRCFHLLSESKWDIEKILIQNQNKLNGKHLDILLGINNSNSIVEIIQQTFPNHLLLLPNNLIRFLKSLKNSNIFPHYMMKKLFPEFYLVDNLPDNFCDIAISLLEQEIQTKIIEQEDMPKQVNTIKF